MTGTLARVVDSTEQRFNFAVIVDDSVLAPGYGHINEQTRAAIHQAAESEGLLLDPVYSGRCMAGLMHAVEHGRISPGSEVLFVHEC